MTESRSNDNPTAEARRLAGAGEWQAAGAVIARLIESSFGLSVAGIEINRDRYSLNSLNGFATASDGRAFFFKFHQEEGESETVGEYYRAEVLRDAGFPIDMPLHVSGEVGRQILLYRRRADPRLADLCRAVELDGGDAAPLVEAQRALDRLIGERYLATLHATTAAQVEAESIHRLFHARLVDSGDHGRLGGRARRFYVDQVFRFPGVTLSWRDLAGKRWRINGVTYRRTLQELFEESRARLRPTLLARHGAVVAHGDAHNANVWVEETEGGKHLVMFDPAFAGRHIPALLAEIKATFHNIFAHPLWLYDAAIADRRFTAAVGVVGDTVDVITDWRLSPLRIAFLESKAELVWRPLLAELAFRGWLPADWRRILRCALFCCPTLVMDLRAGSSAGHTPITSAIGLAMAMITGSEPEGADDPLSTVLDAIAPSAIAHGRPHPQIAKKST
jgi:Ser/Thr protein kinase RdoA (MazF antagonist)